MASSRTLTWKQLLASALGPRSCLQPGSGPEQIAPAPAVVGAWWARWDWELESSEGRSGEEQC